MLPRETREYVPMILAAIVIAHNPAQYGFDFAAEPTQEYEKVMLDRPVDLRRIAEWAETSIDELQSLNPELRRWTTPVHDDQYELKVPMGAAERVQTRLAAAPAVDLASLRWYTVKRGDTLPLIARKLHVSRNDLADANYLPANARVNIGQKLMIPQEATVLMAVNTERSVPPAEARATVESTGGLAEGTTANRVKSYYQVKRGDTLASIAQSFRTTVASLKTWNPTVSSSHLIAGQRLTVYRPVAH
jgi:membrane-bound lytic murein transglycosylase D